MKKKIEVGFAAAILLISVCNASTVKRSTYIVHMDESEMPSSFELDHAKWYESSLSNTTSRMIYAYNNVIKGYAATLTPEEAQAMQDRPDVLSVIPEVKYKLHTTRSPYFLGLEQKQNTPLLPNPAALSNVIVGVVDTGVWPESKSFDDTGLGPIPSHWRGECETGDNFTKSMCNRKLIGARFFLKGYEQTFGPLNRTWESRSPRDMDGHGTHTSTTVAGSPVSGASFFGYANGTARGIAPQARIAMYKCCWKYGHCFGSDILAAMDKAIEDNVDVLSLSLGLHFKSYETDPIAVGAFSAMEKGIFVSCAAGNSGPDAQTVLNGAPWITTVGAGTLDRDFPAPVILGNGENYTGVSLYSGESLSGRFLPFVYAGNATDDPVAASSGSCPPETLIPEKVKGKIVLCYDANQIDASNAVKAAGGLGTILVNPELTEELFPDAYFSAATAVGGKAGDKMRRYLSSSDPNTATATILFQGTKLGVQPAPVLAGFSSRGPNVISPEILKPDLVAPGVNILAGWSEDSGPTQMETDTRRVPYNILSGTSMACPHVSGLAALLKAAHPKWSVAAIRSALMTTANEQILDAATGKQSTPLDHGAGHVNPIGAFDPGLIYDLELSDYLDYLCAINYTSQQIKVFAGKTASLVSCNRDINYSVTYLNYPSFGVTVQANPNGATVEVEHRRNVTNVGEPGTYRVKIISPMSQALNISVLPSELTFNRTDEKKAYTVIFKVNPKLPVNTKLFGRIEWRDENSHVVGSPIAVSWV